MTYDASIVCVNGKHFRRLNSANQPETNPERGTGFVLIDKPRHRGCGPKKKRNEGKR